MIDCTLRGESTMKMLFSIGEVSKLKGVTIKALRYYHKVGILVPKYIDDVTGYRYYSVDQFIHIDIIKACRDLGTNISELETIFKSCDTEELMVFLNQKKFEAERNIDRMKGIIKNIENVNEAVNHSKDTMNKKNIDIELLPERYIIKVPFKESKSVEDLIYYSELEKVIEKRKIKALIHTGTLTKLDIKGNRVSRYVFKEIVFSDALDGTEDIEILPKGRYLTASYTKRTEEKCMNEIKKYMEKNNLKTKIYIEADLLDDIFNTESYSCQIQILLE